MGSTKGDEAETPQVSNSDPTEADDGETQPAESDELDSALQINDTEEVDDPNCGDDTQPLESDGEGEDSERTEILSDNEDRNDGDEAIETGTEKKKNNEEEEKAFVTDSETSTGDKSGAGSGSIHRSFMSVRAASLRASGLVAAQKMDCTGTGRDESSMDGNSQPMKGFIDKDDEMVGPRDSAKFDGDLDTSNCNGCMEGTMEDSKHKTGTSAARKLFAEEASNIVSTNEDNIIKEVSEFPDIVAPDHDLAGLSYVQSQEPGELSQQNALNIVDKLLSVNNVELFEEGNLVKITKQKSPPVSNAKGPQIFAKRVNLTSPVGQVGIFDWVDSREDDRGGDFFVNKKEALLGSDACARGSFTQPKKQRQLHSQKGRGTVDKFDVGKDRSNLHRKIISLTRSDSRLIARNSTEDDKILQQSDRKARKNLFEVEKQINSKTSVQQLKATGISKDAVNICDVGIDTQMAAEAMEALVSGGSTKLTEPNRTESGSVTRKKGHIKQALIQRKDSDSGGVSTVSKLRRILSMNLGGENSPTTLRNSKVRKMKDILSKSGRAGQKRKSVAEQHLSTGNATKENKRSGKRSSRSINKIKVVSAMEEANLRESEAQNGEISLNQGRKQKSHITSTPVTRRTRQSLAVNPMKTSKGQNLINYAIEDAKNQREVTGIKRKRRSLGDSVLAEHEASDHGLQAGTASPRGVKEDLQVCSRRITTRNMSNNLDETLNGEILSDQGRKQKNYATSASVACRTRQALAVNPSKSSEGQNLFLDARKAAKNQVEGTGEKRKRRSLADDALLEQEALDHGPRADTDLESCKKDVQAQSRRITSRTMSDNLLETANLDPPPSVGQRIEDEKGISLPRKKKLKDIKNTALTVDMRTKKRTIVCGLQASSPSEKKSVKSMEKQEVAEPSLAVSVVNCSIAAASGKTLPKDPVQDKATRRSGRNRVPDSLSSPRGVEVNAVSPTQKVKPSGSICVTPVSCTTPMNVASPVCIGDEYHKQSCKKNLSRSSLMRELVRLDATEVLHASPVKDLRKRKDMSQVRVLFSHHLDDDTVKQQKKILTRLGASVACSCSEATHFVANKFVRTRNMLEAIAYGKPVVTHLWLESCGQASCFIDERKHMLRDSKKEKEIGFSMPVSLAHASERPLLQNKRVFITPNVKPNKELVASLVKAVDGTALERLGRSLTKDDEVPDDLLVLSCEEDYEICVPLMEKGAMIYSSELLLNGIVIQKLYYERHQLFVDHVKRRRTRSTSKKGEKFYPVTKCK